MKKPTRVTVTKAVVVGAGVVPAAVEVLTRILEVTSLAQCLGARTQCRHVLDASACPLSLSVLLCCELLSPNSWRAADMDVATRVRASG